MHTLLARAFAALLVVATSAIAAPTSGEETLVVVLVKQSGMRETHLQRITADSCHAMLQLFRAINGNGQPLMLTTPRSSAEALTIFCVEANGEGVDWKGAAVSSEQIQQRTDELITERNK